VIKDWFSFFWTHHAFFLPQRVRKVSLGLTVTEIVLVGNKAGKMESTPLNRCKVYIMHTCYVIYKFYTFGIGKTTVKY
jgi:hypothetical protein